MVCEVSQRLCPVYLIYVAKAAGVRSVTWLVGLWLGFTLVSCGGYFRILYRGRGGGHRGQIGVSFDLSRRVASSVITWPNPFLLY